MSNQDEEKDLCKSIGGNPKELYEYFEIPYRIDTDWKARDGRIRAYVFRMMGYMAEMEKLISEKASQVQSDNENRMK